MSNRKTKNIKNAHAVRRKLHASQHMDKIGISLEDELASIGFILTHLSISQLTYLLLESINHLCRTHIGVDIHIFSQHITNPCAQILCPVFGMHELIRWHKYPIVTTNIATTIDALSSNAQKIYHYAFDPEFIDLQHSESSYIKQAFCDPRVMVITRHESHKQLIEEEFSIKVCDTIIEDCDTEKLIKLILMETKNDQ